jgi:hypothetical protein
MAIEVESLGLRLTMKACKKENQKEENAHLIEL